MSTTDSQRFMRAAWYEPRESHVRCSRLASFPSQSLALTRCVCGLRSLVSTPLTPKAALAGAVRRRCPSHALFPTRMAPA
jgi:hypothetical protein